MNQNNNITSSTINVQLETASSNSNASALLQKKNENDINRNKPWRIVIRRVVSDGGSNYKDISGENESNKSM